jgi:hypothetical protein
VFAVAGPGPSALAPTTCPGTVARASRCDDQSELHASRSAGAGGRRRGGVAARQLLGGGGTRCRRLRGGTPSRFHIRSAFSGPDGWGPRWVLSGAAAGRRRPGGADGARRRAATAADQPMPVPAAWTRCTQTGPNSSRFGVSDANLRRGAAVPVNGPRTFTGVTIEGDRLVIAEYAFDGRRTVATGDTDPLAAGTRARAGRPLPGWPCLGEGLAGDRPEADWQISGPVQPRPRNPGVLAVHPSSLRPCRLQVHSHTVATDAHRSRPARSRRC